MSDPEHAKKEERNDDKSKPSVILSEAKDLQFVRITTKPGWPILHSQGGLFAKQFMQFPSQEHTARICRFHPPNSLHWK
jgi:hypothetical protein